MRDPLLARAALAILENRTLRREAELLRAQTEHSRIELRRSVFESEMQRAEYKAVREDHR